MNQLIRLIQTTGNQGWSPEEKDLICRITTYQMPKDISPVPEFFLGLNKIQSTDIKNSKYLFINYYVFY